MIPQHVRVAVLKRAGRCCEDCGDDKARLELHHLRYWPEGSIYDPFPEAVPGWETPDDLDALCRDCHHGRHLDPNGDFWRDPQEMEDAWFGYHWEMDKP